MPLNSSSFFLVQHDQRRYFKSHSHFFPLKGEAWQILYIFCFSPRLHSVLFVAGKTNSSSQCEMWMRQRLLLPNLSFPSRNCCSRALQPGQSTRYTWAALSQPGDTLSGSAGAHSHHNQLQWFCVPRLAPGQAQLLPLNVHNVSYSLVIVDA